MELFKKEYSAESLCDLGRDISELFDEDYSDIPVDSHGFMAGTFTVSVIWTPTDSEV